MKPRTTLILVVVLALLCAAYWWMGRAEQREQVRKLEAMAVYDFDPAAVQRLTVRQVGRSAVTGARNDDGTWRIEAPREGIPPLDLMWDRVAYHLSELRNHRTIEETPGDLAQRGLDEPALTVTAELAEGNTATVAFGDVEPTERFRYAQVDGGPVVLVEGNQYFELNRSLDDLRLRFLVDNRQANIVRIEFAPLYQGEAIDTGDAPLPEVGEVGVTVVAEREAAGKPWRLLEPKDLPADQKTLNELAKEIQTTLGSNYVDDPENLADYGLGPARFMLTVYDDDGGAPQVIYYGNIDVLSDKGGIYTRREDRPDVFVTPAHFLTLLPLRPESWRETHLLTAQEAPINRIEYDHQGDRFVLGLDSDRGWRVVEPPIDAVDQVAISAFIASLKTITVSHFLDDADPAEYNLDAPLVSIAVYVEGEETPRRITMAPSPDDPDFYAAMQDGGGVTLVHENMANRAFATAEDFRSKVLLQFNHAMAERADFTLDGTRYVFEKAHGVWLVREPEGRELANQSDAQKFLELVSPLRAAAGVPDWTGDPADYGLDAPVFRATVTVRNPDDPSEEVTLGPVEVGALVEEDLSRRYARVVEKGGLFQLPQDLIDSLREVVLGVRSP